MTRVDLVAAERTKSDPRKIVKTAISTETRDAPRSLSRPFGGRSEAGWRELKGIFTEIKPRYILHLAVVFKKEKETGN